MKIKSILFIILYSIIVSNGNETIKLEPADMIRLRKANFSDVFLENIQKNGYIFVSINEMIDLRKSNVTETVILEYALQSKKIDSEDIIKLRKSNFSDPFILTIITRGYSTVISINEMIDLRKNRVSFQQILDYSYPPRAKDKEKK